MADHIGSKHHSVQLDPQQFLDAIPHVVRAIESWDVTTVRASVGNWLVAKYIKENTPFKVVLNGDYSDEIAAGYLYMKLAPDYEELDGESRRLVDNIHFFDSLRSDRTVCAHGLEARTPFADNEFLTYYMSLPRTLTSPRGEIEKYLLRKAFEGRGLIPDSVINRRKEAFSDGVSGQASSWHQMVQPYLVEQGHASEAGAYKTFFSEYYPGNEGVIPYKWMPKYCQAQDPSARTLGVYK